MRRRDLLCTLPAFAHSCRAAVAQTSSLRKIGYLGTATAEADAGRLAAFKGALRDRGYKDGETVSIIQRFAGGDEARVADFARAFVSERLDVIVVATAGVAGVVRAVTDRIPIVVMSAGDLEGTGMIQSLRRPGGNVTGFQILSPDLMTKRLELLAQLVPGLRRVASVEPITSTGTITARYRSVIADAARSLGMDVTAVQVYSPADFKRAFERMVGDGAGGALVIANPLSLDNRVELAAAAAASRLPTAYEFRIFATAGGLISYGPDLRTTPQIAASFVDQLLRGAPAAELPVQQATNFELVVNAKAAREIGITLPPFLLARADDVIE